MRQHYFIGSALQMLSSDSNGVRLKAGDLAGFKFMASTNLVNWEVLTNSIAISTGFMVLGIQKSFPIGSIESRS